MAGFPQLSGAYVGGAQAIFFPESYGAKGDGVTDDTAAIQAAMDAADAAGGGIVWFEAKTYLIAGAFRTDRGGYSQLAYKIHNPNNGPTVELRGAVPMENYSSTMTNGGTVLKSTLTGQTHSATYGSPSVLGGPTAENAGGNKFTYIEAVVRNIAIQVPAGPSIAGADLRFVGRVDWDSSICISADPTTDPGTNYWAFGLRMPDKSNYNKSLIRSGGAYGFWCNLTANTEHLTVLYWSSKWGHIGYAPYNNGGGHGTFIGHMSLEWHAHSIAGYSETAGVAALATAVWLSIDLLDLEDASAGNWFTTVDNINDSANLMKGTVRYLRLDPSSGNMIPLTLSGGNNLELFDLASVTHYPTRAGARGAQMNIFSGATTSWVALALGRLASNPNDASIGIAALANDFIAGAQAGDLIFRLGSATNQILFSTDGNAELAIKGADVGFFGATPAAQPSAAGTATGYAAGTTAATFHSDDTYTGNTGTTAYTINGIVAALKALGLLKT